MIDPVKLAEAWIRYWQKPKRTEHDSGGEAIETLDDMIHSCPSDALHIMDQIVEQTSDLKILAQLGAGPLENLLGSKQGARYFDEILTRARQQKNWRFAFGCVWTSGYADRQLAQRIEESLDIFFPEGRP
ncbi:MAG TPA: hypothetical protein VLF91_04100 [Candidatus Saccharimonadales bacterium]|nr:hypothetical protein [Candidatus Saccharimonadales bacterium]